MTFKSDPTAQRVRLPSSEDGVVQSLAAQRRSTRVFSKAPVTLQQLANLLRATLGPVEDQSAQGAKPVIRRPSPSAGGLYPLELYVLVRNVTGLEPGIYHYDAICDDLEIVSLCDWEQSAAEAFLSWSFAKNCGVLFCLSAVFPRVQAKYGARGYRYALLEAGHAAQNLILCVEERGLASLCLGGFHDARLNTLLNVDGAEEAALYAVAIGTTAKTAG